MIRAINGHTVKVDIHSVAMMNAVEERSCNNHGGRRRLGMTLDLKRDLISARYIASKKPMNNTRWQQLAAREEKKRIGWDDRVRFFVLGSSGNKEQYERLQSGWREHRSYLHSLLCLDSRSFTQLHRLCVCPQ